MEHKQIWQALPNALIAWYAQNHRDLPWRADKDPYHIWLSEVMLQQTRVEAVKGYYSRFLDRLPTIGHLAQADEELLHKLWEGLGYYSRVRNLKKAACIIMEKYGGVFPQAYQDVLSLPGIGGYTAGAICSIAFGQPTPAVDGNVLRLVSRLTNDDTPIDLPVFRKQVHNRLQKVYPDRAGDFTQALMELGATVCGPDRKPDCACCPCKAFCLGCKNGTAEMLPVRQPKKQRRQADMTVFILRCGSLYALQKRQAKGLLAGLWQFPNMPEKLDPQTALDEVARMGLKPRELARTVERTHIFTHVQWNMRGVYMEVAEPDGGFTWLSAEQINRQAALPTAFRQFWEENTDV